MNNSLKIGTKRVRSEVYTKMVRTTMAINTSALCSLDGEFLDDDESELQLQGVKLQGVFDLGGLSRWHDG